MAATRMTSRSIAFEASGPQPGFVNPSKYDSLDLRSTIVSFLIFVMTSSFRQRALRFEGGLFLGATEMGDLAVDSGALPTASILPDSYRPNASSDVSKQLPQSAVGAWNLTFTPPSSPRQLKALDGQPVSPNRWPAEAPAAPEHIRPDRAVRCDGGLQSAGRPCRGLQWDAGRLQPWLFCRSSSEYYARSWHCR
jgi:hypothetical protein